MKIPGKQHRLAPTWGRAVWVGATSELCVFSVRLPPFGRGEWKALSAFSRGIHPACGMPEWLASGDLGLTTLFWFSGQVPHPKWTHREVSNENHRCLPNMSSFIFLNFNQKLPDSLRPPRERMGLPRTLSPGAGFQAW